MITKYGSKPVGERISKLSTAKLNPEILELRAFLKSRSVVKKLVAIRREKIFILWGGGMREEESKSVTYPDGRIEVYRKEVKYGNGILTLAGGMASLALVMIAVNLIISGASDRREAENFRRGIIPVQESSSHLRKNQGTGY